MQNRCCRRTWSCRTPEADLDIPVPCSVRHPPPCRQWIWTVRLSPTESVSANSCEVVHSSWSRDRVPPAQPCYIPEWITIGKDSIVEMQ